MTRLIEALLSLLDNEVVGIAIFTALVLRGAVYFAHRLAPNAQLVGLEHAIDEANELMLQAQEDGALGSRQLRLSLQLQLTQAQGTASLLRLRVLQEHRFSISWLWSISRNIRSCRRDVKGARVAILCEIETKKQNVFSERTREIQAIVAGEKVAVGF
ncbi:hypothetical protein MKEN_01270500 [Mycena kentingensis (nom. inval.)]|nr:hypothetical protein MKEN_01270500 [Mycena kentingensis (nom. inval.)]